MSGVYIDRDEAWQALQAVIASEPTLLAELDELFLREEALYETDGILSYVFVFDSGPTDGTNIRRPHFRPRNLDERRTVLLAPEENGLVARTHAVASLAIPVEV